MGKSISELLIVGSAALCCVGWLVLVVLMLIGSGHVVVVLIGTSPSFSIWFVSLGCCVCHTNPEWRPSL